MAKGQCVCFLNVGLSTCKGITQPDNTSNSKSQAFGQVTISKVSCRSELICDMLAVCFSKQRDIHIMICMSLRRHALLLEEHYGLFWLLRNWKIRCFTHRPSSRNKSSGNMFYRSAACILAFCSQGLAQGHNRVQHSI